jgi:hypothetical protein
MHRQRSLKVPRGERVAKQVHRYGVAATYELHDRILSNRLSRRRYAASPPALDAVQQRIVAELHENGCATVPFGELFSEGELWQEVSAQGDAFIDETERALAHREHEGEGVHVRAGKEFVVRAYEREGAQVDVDDPWFRVAVSDRLLGIANAYLGMWSKLSYVDRWYTVPQPPDAERVASQLWHLDFDDKHLLKAFLYLVDVDADTGPFEYVPGSQPGGRYSSSWRWTPFGTARISDEELARHVPASEIRTFTAPRGTLILCNTSGLHRGGFSTAKPRVLAAATYCSPASLSALSLRNFTLAGAPSLSDPAALYAVT